MNSGIIFAILAAFSFGLWTVFHKQASNNLHPLIGAIMVSLTAVILGGVIWLVRIKSIDATFSMNGVIFIILAGICALCLDFFVLKAYSSGLPITVGGPIVIGGSILVASLIGFFLGESITIMKIVGIILVMLGSGILAQYT